MKRNSNDRRGVSSSLGPAGILVLALIFCLLLSPGLQASVKVADYKVVFRPFYGDDGKLKIAIRDFNLGPVPETLIVDPYTFSTRIIKRSVIAFRVAPDKDWLGTPYVKALYKYALGDRLQNGGIREGDGEYKGVFLTVDMCPSRKGIDKDLYTATAGLTGNGPADIAIAVSGLWIERHRDEFNWIRGLESSGRLRITWVNHTYSHPYESSRPLKENFLLTPGVDVEKEVLGNEVLLIENGITPTPFFRFPGLVSDKDLMARLKSLSLIPVGANAWLSKGEAPVNGSIILVHGNGNDPAGVKDLLDFYNKRSTDFRNGSLKTLPLAAAFR